MPNKAFVDFNLPFDEAIAYFENKSLQTSWRWDELTESAHATAFTVAKGARLDVIQTAYDVLLQSLKNGESYKDFEKNVTPKLTQLGWIGKPILGDEQGGAAVELGTPRRLKLIYQANMQSSYMAGRYVQAIQNVKNRPYWQYWAKMDGKTRPAHAALHGKIFRYDDPFWQHFYPPNGYNCRCTVRFLSQDDVDRLGLAVSSSEGSMGSADVLVSSATGEIRQVATYTFKDDSGKQWTVSPDVGWNGNVGKDYLESLQTLQYQKAQKLGDRSVFTQTLDDISKNLSRKQYEGFVNKAYPIAKEIVDTRANYQLTANLHKELNAIPQVVVGAVDLEVYDFLVSKELTPQVPHIAIDAQTLYHMIRPAKSSRGAALSQDEILAFFEKLQDKNTVVLYDKHKQNVLYVFKMNGINKVAVEVSYVADGGFNRVITSGKIAESNIHEAGYEQIR